MRVISQNGLIDVPYDLTAFHVAGGFIRMNMMGENGKGTVIANYSSEEKAREAMKMMQEAYVRTTHILPVVFFFPKNDEIEVSE